MKQQLLFLFYLFKKEISCEDEYKNRNIYDKLYIEAEIVRDCVHKNLKTQIL